MGSGGMPWGLQDIQLFTVEETGLMRGPVNSEIVRLSLGHILSF